MYGMGTGREGPTGGAVRRGTIRYRWLSTMGWDGMGWQCNASSEPPCVCDVILA